MTSRRHPIHDAPRQHGLAYPASTATALRISSLFGVALLRAKRALRRPTRGPLRKLAWAVLFCLCGVAGQSQTQAPPIAYDAVQFDVPLQRVDGFGVSEAFGQAAAVQAMPEERRKELLNLLFDRATGAGLSILRLGFDTDGTIEPEAPARADTPAHYRFDGSDGGQVWMALQAKRLGVTQFTATAWSAPPFMKTNGSAIGGSLCGLEQTACPTGDWRSAFASYLLQYVRFYRKAGVPIGSLGFLNEADLQVSYASMFFTPRQVLEFLKVLAPAAHAVAPPLTLTCCDASRWSSAQDYLRALNRDPKASATLGVYTAHEYGVHANQPLPTPLPVWMTEWSSGVPEFQPRWDCGSCPGGSDGMYLARDILQAFAKGDVSAYLYWWGAGPGAANLIHLEGTAYVVGKRFYALAGISRFVLPGAHRVPLNLSAAGLEAAAFRNPDGTGIICVLNTGTEPVRTRLRLEGTSNFAGVQTYLTDTDHTLESTGSAQLDGPALQAIFPRRSLTTVVLTPAK